MKTKTKFVPANPKDLNGGGYQGFIRVSYQRLVDSLGKPHDRTKEGPWRSADGKTRAEWAFKTTNRRKQTVVTIYDYKRDESIENLTVWHVGVKGDVEIGSDFLLKKLPQEASLVLVGS